MTHSSLLLPGTYVACVEQDLPAVFNEDHVIFGADREPVLRSLFARLPECAWVSVASGLQGYCFGRPGFLYQQLGPIVARDESIARDLVSQMSQPEDRSTVRDRRSRAFSVMARLARVKWICEGTFVHSNASR